MTEPERDLQTARTQAIAGDLRVVLGKLKRRLREEASFGGLNLSQGAVLTRLEREGPATVTTLARAEGMRPQSMGEIISALKAEGLVAGAPDPNDGRQTVLSITDKCRELIKTARAVREDWLFRALQTKLTAAEQEELAGALALLDRLVAS